MCLWQVNGRNDVKDFDVWVKLDLGLHASLDPDAGHTDPFENSE
jgi:hypothetical protein